MTLPPMATRRADDHHLDDDGQISFVELIDWMLNEELWEDQDVYQDMLDFMEDDVEIQQFAIHHKKVNHLFITIRGCSS